MKSHPSVSTLYTSPPITRWLCGWQTEITISGPDTDTADSRPSLVPRLTNRNFLISLAGHLSRFLFCSASQQLCLSPHSPNLLFLSTQLHCFNFSFQKSFPLILVNLTSSVTILFPRSWSRSVPLKCIYSPYLRILNTTKMMRTF